MLKRRPNSVLPPLEERPLLAGEQRPSTSGGTNRHRRTLSERSLDPNEDPVTGLERVSSINSLHEAERRQRREQAQRQSEQSEARQRSLSSQRHADEHGTLSGKFESLDYELVENELYRAAELDKDHQRQLFRRTVDRWVVFFFIGVVTALVAAGIDTLLYYFSRLKFHFVIKNLVSLCERQTIGQNIGCTWLVLCAWAGFNCLLVGVAAILVLRLSPVAAGSGIPQIKCYLNGVRIPNVMRLKTLFAKAVGVACSVGGGLAAGKEGPMIHSGAVVAAGISQGRSFTFPCFSLPCNLFEYFRNDREKRDFVSAGAAAGVAAAFGSPIGGVLFSLEEGASFWNQELTWRMVFTSMTATFTLSIFLTVFYNVGGFLSWSGLANFGVFENFTYSVWEVPFFMIMGVIGGLLGALFNSLNMKLAKFRKNYVRTGRQKFFEAILVAAASAFAGFITIFFVNDCQSQGVNPQLTEYTKLWCDRGKYSAVANLFFQTPEESVKSLFHSPINAFRPFTLLVFAIEYYCLSLWTYGLSVPSGIFIPLLLTGAAWGRLFGHGVEFLFPTLTGIDPGKYALAGAAAQLGGVVRMTISLTAIIMESTKNIVFGPPIMLVLLIAKWVGDFFNEGLYDSHIELAEIPFLGQHAPKLSRNISARQVMRKDVIALQPKETVGRILDILRSTKHHGFPVVDRIQPALGGLHLGGHNTSNTSSASNSHLHHQLLYPDYGHLVGLVLRSQLIVLLRKRHFTLDYEGRHAAQGQQPVALSDFRACYPRYDEMPIAELGLCRDDERCWLDLRPFLHPSPHRVPLGASLDSIHRLFRGLGLRFLFAVDEENRLRGIITRKDIARFKERRVHKQYMVHEVYISNYEN